MDLLVVNQAHQCVAVVNLFLNTKAVNLMSKALSNVWNNDGI